MLSLRPLQRAIDRLYRLDVRHPVDDFVRPLDARDPDASRREVVLVAQREQGRTARGRRRRSGPLEVAVLLDPDVSRVLRGEPVAGLSRFTAWCLALEGVSHFVLLAHRAANDRPVSELELELQAEVDKFAVALIDRALFRAASEAHVHSLRLRHALFERTRFTDAPDTVRGRRYRLAHRMAARYAAALERRYVREGRLEQLVDELRAFYRAGLETKLAMVA